MRFKRWLLALAGCGVVVSAFAQDRVARALTQKIEAPEWGFDLR